VITYGLVLVAGSAILILETLVVSIQTTRPILWNSSRLFPAAGGLSPLPLHPSPSRSDR
jgi:hypothetical protein